MPATSQLRLLEAAPVVRNSLALTALVERLQLARRYEVLDLGPGLGESVEFWSQFRAKLHVADFYRSLNSSGKLPLQKGESYESVYNSVLGCDSDTRFDIILAWDVFNYLEQNPLEAFIRYLGCRCGPGSLLLVLMSISERTSADPAIFKILDRERLLYENRSSMVRPCVRYQPRELERMMAGFKLLNAFMLRHGMQEYLFVRE